MKQESRLRPLFLAATFVAQLAIVATASSQGVERLRIETSADFGRVETALASSAAYAVEIVVAEGEYEIAESFRIARSRVSLQGEGTVRIRLADGSNCPVIALGTQKSYVESSDHIEDVVVRGLEIDGNRQNQSSEYDARYPWIRNNGIDVRGVAGLVIDEVVSSNCRSGGLVISWGCVDGLVLRSRFENNEFDGLAYYDSARIFTLDCVSSRNVCAGISLDNRFVDSVFARCLLEENGDVGVFARNSERLYFVECSVLDSGQWAFFLAHDEQERGILDSAIVRCMMSGNDGGVRMASVTAAQSRGNALVGNRFAGNARAGRADVDTCGAPLIEQDAYDLAERIRNLDLERLVAAIGLGDSIGSIL